MASSSSGPSTTTEARPRPSVFSLTDEEILRLNNPGTFPHPDKLKNLPIYDASGNVDENDAQSVRARSAACKFGPCVVAVTYFTYYNFLIACSGTIIGWNGVAKILTSAHLLGDSKPEEEATNIEVKVYLPTRVMVAGRVVYVNRYYNIAIIEADGLEADGLELATLEHNPELVQLGQQVIALGRNCHSYELRASLGEINARIDSLEFDDLLSSNCSNVSESWIGGPLIHMSSGTMIGMNYVHRKCTPFLPSILLRRCLEHINKYGNVCRPSLGLSTRSLNQVKIAELESVYLKSRLVDGLVVTKVVKGSLADQAGISVGDVISHCNATQVTSPIEFSVVLLKLAEKAMRKRRRRGVHSPERASYHAGKRGACEVEVVIQRGRNNTEVKRMLVESFDLPESDLPPWSFTDPIKPVESIFRYL